MFQLGMWLGLLFLFSLFFIYRRLSDEAKEGVEFTRKKEAFIICFCLWLTSCGSFKIDSVIKKGQEERDRKARAKKYGEEQAKITPEEKAKAEQENEERKRKFAEQKAEIENEKKERVPKLVEFQKALENNKAIYYDSYEKMVANIQTENESQLRPNVNSALKNFKKAEKEINDLYKKFVESE